MMGGIAAHHCRRNMPSLPEFSDFERWSPQELRQAERVAMEFLQENVAGIADTFDQRIGLLRRLTGMMRSEDSTFEDRMLYLSLLDEIATSISESARDFFNIGSGPRVAKLIRDE
jgi:hypothetical protein